MHNQLRIQVEKASKKFIGEWIFREVNLDIQPAEKIVILGANGSGKSTLMQCISTYQTLTKGTVEFTDDDKKINADKIFQLQSMATPYLELIEDYTLTEAIEHQRIFKPFQQGLDSKAVTEITELGHARNKQIRLYSSGMKQRLKLSLAVLADCPLLLLDEPCSNLDKNAINWYKNLINTYAKHKTILVCSNNIEDEYGFCERQVLVEEYKSKAKAG